MEAFAKLEAADDDDELLLELEEPLELLRLANAEVNRLLVCWRFAITVSKAANWVISVDCCALSAAV